MKLARQASQWPALVKINLNRHLWCYDARSLALEIQGVIWDFCIGFAWINSGGYAIT